MVRDIDNTKINESLLFDYETTAKTDYRDGEILPLVNTTYKFKKKCPRPPYKPIKDSHALTAWKVPNLPFSLYHRPKDIVRTDPKNIQKVYVPPVDVDRAEIQRTRPTVVMTPALDLDSVEEPTRQKFIDHIYVSVKEKALRDAVEKTKVREMYAPLSEIYAPSNPVRIEPLVAPYVCPEWRMESTSWDKRQLRIYTEPTKHFWLSKTLPSCRPCIDTIIKEAYQKRECQEKLTGSK